MEKICVAGVIGTVSKDKNGLANKYMTNSLGTVVLDNESKYARFSINLNVNENATLAITVASTNSNSVVLLVHIAKWNTSYVSNASYVGYKPNIVSLSYAINGNEFSLYVKQKSSYAAVRANYLTYQISSDVTVSAETSLPSNAVQLPIETVFGYNSLAELASGVADTLDLKIQRKTIPSLTGNTTIEIPDMYASYLVAITYSGQSSLFFVSSWGSIAVFAPIVNNLSGITLTGSVGTINLVLSTSGSTYNSVKYCLIRI